MVGISLLTLVPGLSGGSETYARELVRALAAVGELDYRVFAPTIARDAVDGLPGRIIESYPASRSTGGRMTAMARAAVFPRRVRRELDPGALAAIHFPLTIALPRGIALPAATTILDVQHEVYPEFFSRLELAYRKVAYRHALRSSRLVITISNHAKQTIVERLDVAPERVRVVYLGVDLKQLRPRNGARQPFLLYPANRWPHKNHDRLFEAFRLVRREHPELELVLTGSGHEGWPAPEGVVVRGHVARDELVELYQTAAALVFPSLYEGFGLPPIEAMACGCPVAVARAASLPEVCGDAARYFDPKVPEEIAHATLETLAHADELARRGPERAAQFTWEACARAHDEVYRELLAR